MALMSGKVYSNTGAPSNTYGTDGDIYLRLDGMKTTYRKESGAWVAVGSTLGAIPEFISGVGTPNSSLGADEQYYRDTENQDIYYKQGSIWNLVGNLQGAVFAGRLDRAGIGKDLSTPPNLLDSVSLNTVIGVGEYYYDPSCTDKPTTGGGLLKVWREDENYIYQIAQISLTGKLSSRYSNDGGTNWTSWFDYGRTQGYSDVDFLVSGGTQPNSAVSYTQVNTLIDTTVNLLLKPKALGRFKNVAPSPTIQYFNTYNIDSVVRNAAGWSVTFINDLPSADYVVVGNVSFGGGGSVGRSFEPYNQTVSGFQIQSAWGGDNTTGFSIQNGAEVNFLIF